MSAATAKGETDLSSSSLAQRSGLIPPAHSPYRIGRCTHISIGHLSSYRQAGVG